MARDKEIKLRNSINAKVMDNLRAAFPDGRFKDFKYLPNVRGYVIWKGFSGMDYDGRQAHLKKALGTTLHSQCSVWLLTPDEWKAKLEERQNPID